MDYNSIKIDNALVDKNLEHVKEYNSNNKLTVMVTLGLNNQTRMNKLLYELQDPNSLYYHQFLNADQFDKMFSPLPSHYYPLSNYFQSHGLEVATAKDRVSIILKGTAKQFENVFNTNLIYGTYDGRTVFEPLGEISISSPLGAYIQDVVGLDNTTLATQAPLFEGSSSEQTIYGGDMQKIYQLNQLYKETGYPTGETIAIIDTAGENSNNQSVAPYVPSDISYYFNHNIPGGEPKSNVYGYPIDGALPPGNSASSDAKGWNTEDYQGGSNKAKTSSVDILHICYR